MKHTEIFYSCIFHLPYTIVEDAVTTFFVSHLGGFAQNSCFTDFQFFVYRFHGNVDYYKKYITLNFNPFPVTGIISLMQLMRRMMKS